MWHVTKEVTLGTAHLGASEQIFETKAEALNHYQFLRRLYEKRCNWTYVYRCLYNYPTTQDETTYRIPLEDPTYSGLELLIVMWEELPMT